jgi:hypothetical protein
MPYLRPLATIMEDTIEYGFDDDGAGVHDVIGSRCDPYTNFLLSGLEMNSCCHSNLTRQALRDGLGERDVHDVLNVFMCTGFTRDTHQYFTKPSPVVVGDYLEFLAETDLLVSASTCPQGDVSMACGAGGEPVNSCTPSASRSGGRVNRCSRMPAGSRRNQAATRAGTGCRRLAGSRSVYRHNSRTRSVQSARIARSPGTTYEPSAQGTDHTPDCALRTSLTSSVVSSRTRQACTVLSGEKPRCRGKCR